MTRIDYFWEENGLFDIIPAPYHYSVALGAILLPIILIFGYCFVMTVEKVFDKPSYSDDAKAN